MTETTRNSPKTRRKVTAILLGFFFLLCAVFFVYYYNVTKERPVRLKTLGEPGHKIGAFSFTDQTGATVTDKDVAGKIRVVEYFFTTCKGICPKMNEALSKVYDQYRYNDRVLFLSHTVDPKKDTVGAMNAYSKKFNADPKHWKFLTGDKKELYDMARYSYLINAMDDTAGVSIDKDFIHSEFFILVDEDNNIRGNYDGTNPAEVNRLISELKILLDEK
jgi:protein SCO1/2